MTPVELFLALRYLKGSRRALGGALTSGIAVAGVTVGVAALIATLAVMTGFREDIRDKILGAQPHLLVQPPEDGTLVERDYADSFKNVPEVVAWSPYVYGQALLRAAGGTRGVVVKGVDANREPAVTGLDRRVVVGRWNDLAGAPSPAVILLGKELANQLSVGLGDRVVLAVSGGDAVLGVLPRMTAFVVGGIVQTGLYDYDASLAIVSLPVAQSVFGQTGRLTGLGVRLKDADQFMDAATTLQTRFAGQAYVRSWLSLNRPLFAALKLEKIVMFLILALITLVAAFTILSNLLLVTAQRAREIGILRALGATPGMIQRVFLLKGLILGLAGTLAGLVLGLSIAALLKRYEFIKLPADIYYVERLPVRVVPGDVVLVVLITLGVVLLATLYPARAAARQDVLDAIHL